MTERDWLISISIFSESVHLHRREQLMCAILGIFGIATEDDIAELRELRSIARKNSAINDPIGVASIWLRVSFSYMNALPSSIPKEAPGRYVELALAVAVNCM
jgi:hypothetical protein